MRTLRRLKHPAAPKPLPRDFYERDCAAVARELLGHWLVHRIGRQSRIGRIVEVEAYLGPHDRASHSRFGRTARNAAMFGPPGHAYVYFIYGMHHCFNVVAGPVGSGAAVLIRALEPISGITGYTNGPALLCRAMNIDLRDNECDLSGPRLCITKPDSQLPTTIIRRSRIGVGYSGLWSRRLLRFYLKGNPFISQA